MRAAGLAGLAALDHRSRCGIVQIAVVRAHV